jgi:hypothetical protein
MTRSLRDAGVCALLASVMTAGDAGAQAPPTFPVPRPSPPVFASAAPLAVTFATNIRQLRGDKSEDPPWRAATLTYDNADGKSVAVPARARTRGIFRLKNCDFPPVRLNFGNQATRGTVFAGLDKPKLVNYCKDNPAHEEYVLQEFQLYRVYNVLTEASHEVRLLRLTYSDSAAAR